MRTRMACSGTKCIACRYLCTTSIGEIMLHMYGGIVERDEVPLQHQSSESRMEPQRHAILFSMHIASDHASSPRRDGGDGTSPQPTGRTPPLDDIQCMDEVIRARSIMQISFDVALPDDAEEDRHREERLATHHNSVPGGDDVCITERSSRGYDAFLHEALSEPNLRILSSLSIEAELFDLSLPPSVSGAREERIEGLRRVLPLVVRNVPMVRAEPGTLQNALEGSSSTIVPVSFGTVGTNTLHLVRRRSSQMPSDPLSCHEPFGGALSSVCFDSDPSAFDLYVHLEDTFEHMISNLAYPGVVANTGRVDDVSLRGKKTGDSL